MMTPTQSDTFIVHTDAPEASAVPEGFRFAGVRSGIKQARPDLGAILADAPAVVAGTFTQNEVRAACVDRNAGLLPSDRIRAIVVNSGNANAMTGAEGEAANVRMAAALASELGVPPEAILTGSTGLIGLPLPVQLVEEAAGPLVQAAGRDPMDFARAVITTDTHTKVAHAQVVLPGDDATIKLVGIAKGSGMIHPNMATTMGFVCTDARVAPGLLQRLLKEAIDDTFNAITVDGDTSTNDMVIVLASGKSGSDVEGEARTAAFAAALRGILAALARQVAADGEGATRLLQVTVRGAPDRATARALARGVCRSSLVKCSTFAGAPEWGRVGMALGQTAAEIGVQLDQRKLSIAAQDVVLFAGDPQPLPHAADLRRALKTDEIRWTIDLGLGDGEFTAYGCDLGYDYVRINADEAKQIEVGRSGGVTRTLTLAAYSPRLKYQLLCEGLAYVRRFTGLKLMVYLAPSATLSSVTSMARDLELCLDAGLKPLAIVPSAEVAQTIEAHMQATGHYTAHVPPDPVTITNFLDRGHLCTLVREAPDPEAIVELALKLGIAKLVALGNDQGIRDAHGVVQRMAPDTLLAGLERNRFDSTDPDLLVLARHAAHRGVPATHILDARIPHAVVGELFTDEGVGTLITRQALG
jgi:acetylglutamate kinase